MLGLKGRCQPRGCFVSCGVWLKSPSLLVGLDVRKAYLKYDLLMLKMMDISYNFGILHAAKWWVTGDSGI